MSAEVKSTVSRKPEVVRGRILDAAQAEFMAHGYEAASTNRILARFGGSKPTMFRHFPSKRALYEGVVARIAARWSEAIDWHDLPPGDPAIWLENFARRALAWILSAENLFLGRMAVIEGQGDGAAMALYRDHASRPIEALLAGHLAAWTEQGKLSCTDPQRDAQAFLDLTLAGEVSRCLYGMPLPTPADMDSHAAHAAGLFLAARLPRS